MDWHKEKEFGLEGRVTDKKRMSLYDTSKETIQKAIYEMNQELKDEQFKRDLKQAEALRNLIGDYVI